MEKYTKLYPWALLLIALTAGGIVLSTSSELKILEDAVNKQAAQAVTKKVLQQVSEKYPQLSPEEKARIASEETQNALKSEETKKAIKEAANKNKALFKEEGGTPYLLGTDSYYYLRYAENIINNGHQGETLRNGTPYDTLRRAPTGIEAEWTLLPALEALWHKTWNVLSPASLTKTTFYLPVALGMASIALIFALALTIYRKTETAFFAAMLFAVHPYFFRQNMAGFADTPAIIMPLSLGFFLSLLWVIQGTKKQKITAGACAAASLIALLYTWQAWYYVLAIIAAFCFTLPFYTSARLRIISILAGTAIAAFFWQKKHFSTILTKLQFLNAGTQTTVQELSKPSLPEFTAALGDTLFTLLLLTAACWTAYRIAKKQATIPEFFLLIWLLAMLVPAARILRFMFFLIPPATIMTANLMQKIQESLARLAASCQIAGKTAASMALAIILPAVVSATMIDTSNMPLPPMNAATAETGDWLRQNSQEDAIIHTWWDYGYVWQYASRRATPLDAGPGTRTSRWIAKALLSENATYSRNILRMTACSRSATETTLNQSVEALEKALKQESPIQELEEFTHCNPREAYVIIDKHTLDVINSIEAESLKSSEPVSSKAPSNIQSCEKTSSTTLECWGYTVDLEQADAFKKDKKPFSTTIITNGTATERILNPESEVALIVYQEKDIYRSVLVPPEYKSTLIVRLFTGAKTNHFTLVHQTDEPERIMTWKINWNDKAEESGQPSSLPETLS